MLVPNAVPRYSNPICKNPNFCTADRNSSFVGDLRLHKSGAKVQSSARTLATSGARFTNVRCAGVSNARLEAAYFGPTLKVKRQSVGEMVEWSGRKRIRDGYGRRESCGQQDDMTRARSIAVFAPLIVALPTILATICDSRRGGAVGRLFRAPRVPAGPRRYSVLEGPADRIRSDPACAVGTLSRDSYLGSCV